ncbi:MAG: hypothetical protein IJZ85_08975 [Lachnospiraceae bacterium]|nr:hypothetical protein [Lachnospiraceae bacterium]
MIEKLIEEIDNALLHDLYFAAMSLALALPDICGRAEYPNANVTTRYILWYNEYIGQYEQCSCDACRKAQMPYLSGEVIYNLRNSFLHQGTPNIDSSKIKDSANKLDEFTLVFEKKNEFDIYVDASSIISSNDGDVSRRSYRVNVRRLCQIITLNAKGYYHKNRDKFDFFNYKILDWDRDSCSLFGTTEKEGEK